MDLAGCQPANLYRNLVFAYILDYDSYRFLRKATLSVFDRSADAISCREPVLGRKRRRLKDQR